MACNAASADNGFKVSEVSDAPHPPDAIDVWDVCDVSNAISVWLQRAPCLM